MKRLKMVFGILIVVVSVATAMAADEARHTSDPIVPNADISRTLTYQGILKNSSGDPVADSSYHVTFRIYNDASGGAPIWTSSLISITTSNGYFKATIGPVSLPFNQQYYLSCQIQGDLEMTQLQEMTMAPYSASSDTANYAFNSGGNSQWVISNNVIYTNGYLGIARAGNILYGDSARTMVNFGVACTTGTNVSNANYAAVGGGYGNKASASSAAIGGGQSNRASGQYSTIAGGHNNMASFDIASIGGGKGNVASGWGATVSGGYYNAASVDNSTVGGGFINAANGAGSIISGGRNNVCNGQNSTVSGGTNNHASGDYSAIPGGNSNQVGDYDMAFGNGVYIGGSYRVGLFNASFPGLIGINRDDNDGGINYPIQVGINANNGNGAYLTFGGVWTNGCSRTFKENFTPYDGNELLAKIANLSITSYNYKNSTEKHFGPVAEEFVGAFDTGVIRKSDGKRDDMYLSSGDVAGVALAGVQELIKQNQELKKMITELQKQVEELKK